MAMDAASAMGSIALWGFSPAIDFTVESSNPGAFEFWNEETCDTANILLIGAPDLSHILQNLPEALRRTSCPVDFYILENGIEVYARQLLLLWLLCEPPDSVGLQDKVWMFLEIVGNTLVRPSTARYITETATKLIELVTGGDGCASLPLVSLAELRHRERDQLAAVFQFWRTEDSKIDVAHMWDLRLRQQLAQRYDARRGVFDWDYFMRLKDRLEVEFIQPEDYKHWRETGIAFRRPGTEQTCVNRTLVTTRALGRPGERQLRRGYWGDIVSGPYASFGLRSDDPSLSRKQNGRLAANAATVSAANLEALFSAMSASLSTASHVRVRFLPADGGAALGRRAAYRHKFSAAVISSGMSHLLTPSVTASLQEGAVVILETARYVVCVTEEQQGRLLEKYEELADTAGCRPFGEEREPARCVREEVEGVGEKRGGLGAEQPEMTDGGGLLVKDGETPGQRMSGEEARLVNEEKGNGRALDMEESVGGDSPSKEKDDKVTADVREMISQVTSSGGEELAIANSGCNEPVTVEDGAGEPKLTTVAQEKSDEEITKEAHPEKPQYPVDQELEGKGTKNDAASKGRFHKQSDDSASPKADTVSDNTSSSPPDFGKTTSGLDGKRRWVSDKLASIPEWVCFVKRDAGSGVA